MKFILLFVFVVTRQASQVQGSNEKLYDGKQYTDDHGRTEEAYEKRDIFEINKDIEGLIDVDVISSRNTKNTQTDPDYFWTSTTIPFVYSNETLIAIGLEAVGAIELARQEYRLRTCLDFVPRTDEENYISFERRSGCFSYIGMLGGAQTISIGSGCENMATVCHEMMHAIGIWHEQSRADRDDYVDIQWDIIQEGRENNFNKYDWVITDAQRIPYDYNSIMHYGDTGFSTTGDPTIVARDPAFQDVIGQRNAFSKGDSTKINRMYKCSDTLLNSYNCNFADQAECGYVNDFDSDDVDWLRYDVGDKSVTVSPNVPSTDATLGISGSYMVLDTSQKLPGKMAEIRSMRSITKSAVQCLQFSFYMHISTGSTASIAVHVATLDDINGTIIDAGDPVVVLDKNYGEKWQVHRMSIQAPSAYRIVFMGKTGGYDTDVIAIDDVSVQDKRCEDGYFVKQDYSTILSTYTKGDFYLSPIMTSTQGYNFRLKIYPRGTTSAVDGYMSMFFGIVQGPNDDELAWPFCNKFVRMMIVDQNDNPQYALNRYSEYLTTQTAGGDLWNKPTSDEAAGYYGYSNFVRISELQTTNNYLKHDSMMISMLIKDMNWVRGDVCNGTFTRSNEKAAPMKAESDHGRSPDFDWGDRIPEFGQGDNDDHQHHHDHHDDDHDHHDDDHHHDHHDDDHDHHDDDHHHDHHDDDHDHDDDHHNHDDDHDSDGMVPVGLAVGIAAGSSVFVLLVMSGILCCIVRSHKQNMRTVANNVVVHTSAPAPPTYSDEKITFEPLSRTKV